jgi:hypothetical protein
MIRRINMKSVSTITKNNHLPSVCTARKAKQRPKNADYTEVNIKEGMPFVSDALKFLRESIERCRKSGFGCILIIHGYGSHGIGGAINFKARQWLHAQVRSGGVKTVVHGEDFNIFNAEARELKSRYPELEVLTRVCNHGVTVVEL